MRMIKYLFLLILVGCSLNFEIGIGKKVRVIDGHLAGVEAVVIKRDDYGWYYIKPTNEKMEGVWVERTDLEDL